MFVKDGNMLCQTFALPFGRIMAYVPMEPNKISINGPEHLVLSKTYFFFDFGDEVSSNRRFGSVVKGHELYFSFSLGASLRICLILVVYDFEGEGTGIRSSL
jgi:hypothetical protein